MIWFAKQRAKQLSLILLPLASAACSRAPATSSTATFYVDSITADSVQQTTLTPTDDFHRQSTIVAKACLKDVAQMQPILANSFRILDASGKGVGAELPVDEKGCIRWDEKLAYLRTASETFVPLTRKIEALGRHHGTLEINIAINPWKPDASALADLSKVSVTPIAANAKVLKSENVPDGSARVVARELSVNFADPRFSGSEANILMVVSANPVILRQGSDGARLSEAWSRGNARISVILYERIQGSAGGAGDQVNEIARTTMVGSLDRGEFRASERLRITRMPPRTSLLELAFRLEPETVVPGLQGEAGMLRVKSLNSETRGRVEDLAPAQAQFDAPAVTAAVNPVPAVSTATVTAVKSGKVPNTAVRTSIRRPPAATTCSDGSDQFGFYLKDWNGVFRDVTRTSKTTNTPTQVAISMTACIATTGTEKSEPIIGQPLEVGLGNGKLQPATTEGDGCAHWTEYVSFDYFSTQRWLGSKLTVRSRQAPYENITRSVPAAINPWQRGQEVFWDCRNGAVPPMAKTAHSAQLELTDFTYTYTGQSYSMDEALTLTFHRHYRMKMTPKIRRWSAIDQAPIYDSIVQDGQYMLRGMLLTPAPSRGSATPTIDQFKFVSGFEKPVEVRAGVIVADISFAFDHQELPLVAARNDIFFELAPIEANSSLAPVTVSGVFVALRVSDGTSLVPDLDKVREFSSKSSDIGASITDLGGLIRSATAAKARRKAEANKAANLAALAKTMNATVVGDQELARHPFRESDIFAATAKDYSLQGKALEQFCPFLYQGFDLQKCSLLTTSYIKARAFKQITGKPFGFEQIPTRVDFISIQAKVSRDYTENKVYTEGDTDKKGYYIALQGKGNVGMPESVPANVSVGGQVGANWGHDWFRTHAHALTDGRSSGTNISLGATLTTEVVAFAVDAPIRHCALLSTVDKDPKKVRNAIVCTKPERKTIEEYYHYMQQNWVTDPTAARDTTDVINRPFTKVIRGQAAYNLFKGQMENRLIEISLQKDLTIDHFDKYLDATARFVNSYPQGADGGFLGIHE